MVLKVTIAQIWLLGRTIAEGKDGHLADRPVDFEETKGPQQCFGDYG